MTTKINDIKVLQSAIVDLMDGKYNTGDNDTGLSDARFMDLVALKDAILNTK
jgi:hypothetical protein